jgi:hypothetical protein
MENPTAPFPALMFDADRDGFSYYGETYQMCHCYSIGSSRRYTAQPIPRTMKYQLRIAICYGSATRFTR